MITGNSSKDVFSALGKVFGMDAVKKYEFMSAAQGYTESCSYLVSAKRGQDNAMSDWSYWMWGDDIAFATVLVSVFKAMKRGVKKFPPFPDTSQDVTMDMQAKLEVWAEQLNADHGHRWETCSHAARSAGNNPHCKTGKIEYGGLVHSVCDICGKDKYDERALMSEANAELAKRKNGK